MKEREEERRREICTRETRKEILRSVSRTFPRSVMLADKNKYLMLNKITFFPSSGTFFTSCHPLNKIFAVQVREQRAPDRREEGAQRAQGRRRRRVLRRPHGQTRGGREVEPTGKLFNAGVASVRSPHIMVVR